MADTIIKVRRTKNFFFASAIPFQDPDLSFKAKGILAYMLSKPPTWTIRMSDLSNRSRDGRKSVRAGIRELITAGYARYITPRKADGSFRGKMLVVRETLDLPWES